MKHFVGHTLERPGDCPLKLAWISAEMSSIISAQLLIKPIQEFYQKQFKKLTIRKCRTLNILLMTCDCKRHKWFHLKFGKEKSRFANIIRNPNWSQLRFNLIEVHGQNWSISQNLDRCKKIKLLVALPTKLKIPGISNWQPSPSHRDSKLIPPFIERFVLR